ncbi:CLD1 Cardiolipin-specific deacylase 1 [Candida maltosa Xu316]
MNSKNWVIHAIDLFGYGCSSRPSFHPNSLEQVETWFHDTFATWMNKRNIPKDNTIIMAHSMGAYLMATYGINRDPEFCHKLLMVSPGAVIKHRKPVSVPKYFTKLWEQNISPFTIVRKAGPLGSKVVSGWSSRRFAKLSPKAGKLLHKYSYAIFQGNGSGEYMLNFLLAPGADARHPLIDRGIDKLKCELSWWYGKEDWMDKKGGELCSEIINTKYNCKKSDVKVIEDSGHHIYLDNIDKFNSLIIGEMENFKTNK